LSGRIVKHRQAGGLAPRINFETQKLWVRFGNLAFEDQHKRKASIHRRLAGGEQLAGEAWMDRIKWPFVRIDDQHV
jgi:hypothetical protein